MSAPASGSRHRLFRPHPIGVVVGVLLVGAAAISIVAGRPEALPDIALESSALLYIERGIVVFVGLLLALIVLEQAWRGYLPSEISGRGVKYERLRDETEKTLTDLTTAIAEERKKREALEKRVGKPG